MNAKSFMKGTIFGLLVGATAGLLLAPKSGEETRKDLKNAANEWSKKFAKGFGKMKDYGRDRLDEMYEMIVSSYQKMDLSEEQKEEIKDELKESYNRIKEIVNEE